MSEIQLVVQGDDLGMCHAVNEGIQQAFEEGILRQTVAMAPCPWIDEAAAFVKASGIHAGMHCTLTSEWDFLRWRPFTDGASLREADGTFHRTLEASMAELDGEEAAAELEAQHAHLSSLGIAPSYFDCHMGPTSRAAFDHVVEKYERPFLYPLASSHYAFESSHMLSPMPAREKLDWLLGYIDGLTPGTHYLCTHPGTAGIELASITRPEAPNFRFAEEYRVSDLDVLTHSAVRDRIDARGIELTTVEGMRPKSK